jgi:alginate O-acetyltransferase complex protein AlgI
LIDLPVPSPLFNPITSREPLTLLESLAGPFGLIAFLPLVPVVRWVGRTRPATAIVAVGSLWVIATAGPLSAAILGGGVALGVAWIQFAAGLSERGRVTKGTGISLVWVGLTALLFPLWWHSQWSWYGWSALFGGPAARLAALHNLGFAYFYLRLIGWGVDMVRSGTRGPFRALETAAWLAYPPCMRLGPVLSRPVFLERLAAWKPETRPPWREIGRRFGLFILGGVALGVLAHNLPEAAENGPDFFSAPQNYSTDQLFRVVLYGPVIIYFLLWTYNELAAVLALWTGIRVDNNFDWLPTATSVRDFWRRWHVTVGAWLREYVYIPLGGNRSSPWFTNSAVFLFCAVWHGPSWSFLAWGATQALALIAQRMWDRVRGPQPTAPRPGRSVATPFAWFLTISFQVITILIFLDFEYSGTRILPELLRRIVGGSSN